MKEILDKVIGAGDKFTIIREEAKTIYGLIAMLQILEELSEGLRIWTVGHILRKIPRWLSLFSPL